MSNDVVKHKHVRPLHHLSQLLYGQRVQLRVTTVQVQSLVERMLQDVRHVWTENKMILLLTLDMIVIGVIVL